MLMHAPITTFAFVVASEGKSGSAVMVQVLVWGASFWAIVAIVAWANGGRLTRPREKAARLGAPV
jgi:hypothetical protein